MRISVPTLSYASQLDFGIKKQPKTKSEWQIQIGKDNNTIGTERHDTNGRLASVSRRDKLAMLRRYHDAFKLPKNLIDKNEHPLLLAAVGHNSTVGSREEILHDNAIVAVTKLVLDQEITAKDLQQAGYTTDLKDWPSIGFPWIDSPHGGYTFNFLRAIESKLTGVQYEWKLKPNHQPPPVATETNEIPIGARVHYYLHNETDARIPKGLMAFNPPVAGNFDLFISYHPADYNTALGLANYLAENDISVIMRKKDSKPQKEDFRWPLNNSRKTLVLLSPESIRDNAVQQDSSIIYDRMDNSLLMAYVDSPFRIDDSELRNLYFPVHRFHVGSINTQKHQLVSLLKHS